MKIEQIHIENFRVFEDETVHLDDYTCFVGPNGAGKLLMIMSTARSKSKHSGGLQKSYMRKL